MRLKIFLVLAFAVLTLGQILSMAQESGTSLADFARKERERKKDAAQPKTVYTNEGAVNASQQDTSKTPSGSAAAALSASAGKAAPLNVVGLGVGVGLVVPPEMQMSKKSSDQAVILDCKENAATCFARVESETIPAGKQAITDSDRKAWDERRPAHIAGKFSRDASRDLTVASYPAYEVMLRDEQSRRLRVVYVLATEARRLYAFNFQGASPSADEFDKWAPVFEAVLQSFRPTASASVQPQIASDFDGLSTAEKHALFLLMGFTGFEDGCKQTTGKYLAVEGTTLSQDTGKACQSPGNQNRMDVAGIRQFLSETGYHLQVIVRGDGYDASVTSKQPGLRAFLTDGKRWFVSRKGPASHQDPSIDFGEVLRLLERGGSQ